MPILTVPSGSVCLASDVPSDLNTHWPSFVPELYKSQVPMTVLAGLFTVLSSPEQPINSPSNMNDTMIFMLSVLLMLLLMDCRLCFRSGQAPGLALARARRCSTKSFYAYEQALQREPPGLSQLRSLLLSLDSPRCRIVYPIYRPELQSSSFLAGENGRPPWRYPPYR